MSALACCHQLRILPTLVIRVDGSRTEKSPGGMPRACFKLIDAR